MDNDNSYINNKFYNKCSNIQKYIIIIFIGNDPKLKMII